MVLRFKFRQEGASEDFLAFNKKNKSCWQRAVTARL